MDAEQLKRVKARIDFRLNEILCEMKPNYDDSIVGFNQAWDIVRKVFEEELTATESTDARMERVDESMAKQLADALTANAKLQQTLLASETHGDTLRGVVNKFAARVNEQAEHIALLTDAVQTLAKNQTLE
jgi:hypothetical protein